LIALHLDAGQQLAAAKASLLDARTVGELRDQFIAVLGHDLRNPLGSIAAGTQLLRQTPLSEKAISIIAMMDKSVVRMSGLIRNVLDFARGRLGGGITVEPSTASLEPVLQQVIDELQSIHPEHQIDTKFDLANLVGVDAPRIGQLLSNLLANALTYSEESAPVRVTARTTIEHFALVVCNNGEPIPPAAMERLFQPFSRGDVRPSQQGLGLGLYIASEIARAHRGTISATSSAEETCFTFTMPLRWRPGLPP
jgi:signal transduction histidine kinase